MPVNFKLFEITALNWKMFDITQRISVIRALLAADSQPTLTYAALECRLTIEQVCYDRLKMSYGHISYADLRRWQPKDVVRQVVEDANEFAASGLTISISKIPVESNSDGFTRQEFEALEYVHLGEQAGFNLNELGRLWNALSNVALHAQLPADSEDSVQVYGPSQKIKQKILEAIKELEKLKSGTLLAGAMGTNYFFLCDTCGIEIRRIEKLLKHGQIISCVNPNCNETYLIYKETSETLHCRRVANLVCESCDGKLSIPLKLIDKLRIGNQHDAKCELCGHFNQISLVPVQLKKAKPEKLGGP